MEIIGHQKIKDYFKEIIKQKRFTHAYLFSGPKGVGKTTFAFYLAKAILCPQKISCVLNDKECSECKKIEKNNHPDLLLIDGQNENIKIEEIRNLKSFLGLKPYSGLHKVVIITKSENMTLEAANALLKSLEEPISNTIFILTSENTNLLPQTIISRCQVIKFNLVSPKEIQKALKKMGEKESYELAIFSGGRPGFILNQKDNKDFWEQQKELIKKTTDLLSMSYLQKYGFVEEIVKDPLIINEVLDLWEILLRDVLLYKNKGGKNTSSSQNLIKEFANKLSQEKILKLINEVKKAKFNLSTTNVNAKLLLENLVLKFNADKI